MNDDARLHDHCEPKKRFPVFRLDYTCLREKGFACFMTGETKLLVAFRGTGLIDVFDANDWRHVAFLDFDIQREIHMDSAFGSPLIGLPFSADLGRTVGVTLYRFDDLRRNHHYGFFVESDYRNKGRKGVWNLDELMLAIALEYAEGHHLQWFHIKPTGDTAPYYRRKYSATRLPTTASERISSIRLGSGRKPLPHIGFFKSAGRTRYLDVDIAMDLKW